MAVSLTRFSWSSWGGGGVKEEKELVSNGSTLNSSSSSEWDLTLKEREMVKFPLVKETQIAPSHRKVKRKWQSREERRIDREYDVVLVPSDGGGGCLSDSESDYSDWSIGWLEPLGSDFQSDGDDGSNNSFAVLVPCYKEVKGSNNVLLSAIKNLSNEFSSAGKNYMEQWLVSLQNFEA